MERLERHSKRLPKSEHAVWAIALLSAESETEVHRFLISSLGVSRQFLRKNLHLTIYHSRRRLPGLEDYQEDIKVEVEPKYWRFMTIAPGGENPRPDIDTSKRPVGVRIQRAAPAYNQILELRSRFYPFETQEALAGRKPSGDRRSAFGSHHYQPHVSLLRSGSGIDPSLSKAGVLFRTAVPKLTFDRFSVRCLTSAKGNA